MPREITQGCEALDQLRPYWDKILVLMMRKAGVRELTIDVSDLMSVTSGPALPYIIVLGRQHLGPDKGFTLVVTDSVEEMSEILAKYKVSINEKPS